MHYSGYSEAELKPTAQLMLDYVVRTSPMLVHLLPNPEDGDDAGASNPLQMSPISHENVHPNFIKKYAAKKVSSDSNSPKTPVRSADRALTAPLLLLFPVLQSFDVAQEVGRGDLRTD